jgi:hypothetical protein
LIIQHSLCAVWKKVGPGSIGVARPTCAASSRSFPFPASCPRSTSAFPSVRSPPCAASSKASRPFRLGAADPPAQRLHQIHDVAAGGAIIQGNNPATINVGDTYTDLGVIVHDNQGNDLSYRTFINGVLTGNILIDTSQVATDTIDYVAHEHSHGCYRGSLFLGSISGLNCIALRL